MKCYACDGEVHKVCTTAKRWWGKHSVPIHGVVQHVCQACGEVVYNSEQARII